MSTAYRIRRGQEAGFSRLFESMADRGMLARKRIKIRQACTDQWQVAATIARAVDGMSPSEAGLLLKEMGAFVECRSRGNQRSWRLKAQ